jgi:hypothetical protein
MVTDWRFPATIEWPSTAVQFAVGPNSDELSRTNPVLTAGHEMTTFLFTALIVN